MDKFTTYFIADAHGSVKIGHSFNIPARLATLQAAHAHKLTLLGATEITETIAQVKWACIRLRGEWFELTPKLRRWIESVSRPWAESQRAEAARKATRAKRRRHAHAGGETARLALKIAARAKKAAELNAEAVNRDATKVAELEVAKAAIATREADCLREFMSRNPL